MKKRILCLVLAAVLMVFCFQPFTVSALENIYFVAVNDTIPLTLPTSIGVWYSGANLYAPQNVFNASGLGITPSYNEAAQTFTLFSRNKRLVFDLAHGGSTDENDKYFGLSAILRGGTVYVPVSYSVAHFGYGYSLLTSKDGYKILRFTNGSQIYDNNLFVEKSENLIRYRVEQSASSKPDSSQTTPPEQKPEEKPAVFVYLALKGADAAEKNLASLAREKARAVFFFTAEELKENKALVRKIYVSGFPVGLTVAPEEQDVSKSLADANYALYDALGFKTLLALLNTEQEKSAEGYCVIHTNRATTAAKAAEKAKQSSLLVIDGSCAQTLTALKKANTTYLILRETSPF